MQEQSADLISFSSGSSVASGTEHLREHRSVWPRWNEKESRPKLPKRFRRRFQLFLVSSIKVSRPTLRKNTMQRKHPKTGLVWALQCQLLGYSNSWIALASQMPPAHTHHHQILQCTSNPAPYPLPNLNFACYFAMSSNSSSCCNIPTI